ncbi:hypothetical protein GCM10011519_07700 [Marmoricola endophyticus]|uniref:Insertion element protein n=1 Tax=Marmoricola endophyticus TaxID=2040280 RepID=A0A917BCW0_9ACTN|nr:hypothetical protein GCM10011519_07700 [Marmoricola endophyticus]
MSARAFPNLCPYCGDENLWPHEPGEGVKAAGAWECRSCLRAFSLSMLGQIPRPEPTSPRSTT